MVGDTAYAYETFLKPTGIPLFQNGITFGSKLSIGGLLHFDENTPYFTVHPILRGHSLHTCFPFWGISTQGKLEGWWVDGYSNIGFISQCYISK